MSLTDAEWVLILNDASKRIRGDIRWTDDEDHLPAQQFLSQIDSLAGRPLFVKGYCNQQSKRLSYSLILSAVGRIYGLDLGCEHHNPQCNRIGEKHAHKWSERYQSKEAYVPEYITAPISDPVTIWRQFCGKACLQHDGVLEKPVL